MNKSYLKLELVSVDSREKETMRTIKELQIPHEQINNPPKQEIVYYTHELLKQLLNERS